MIELLLIVWYLFWENDYKFEEVKEPVVIEKKLNWEEIVKLLEPLIDL